MGVAFASVDDLKALRARGVLSVFLGTDDATAIPYFAVDLAEKAEDEARTFDQAHATGPCLPVPLARPTLDSRAHSA